MIFFSLQRNHASSNNKRVEKKLLLPQINFQWVKFSVLLKFNHVFSFFSKTLLQCASNIRLTPNAFNTLYKYTE